MASPQGESWWVKYPNSRSSLPLVFSRGFLLAKSNWKWEGEEAHWCTSHQSALESTAGRERWRVGVEGQLGDRLHSHHGLLHL